MHEATPTGSQLVESLDPVVASPKLTKVSGENADERHDQHEIETNRISVAEKSKRGHNGVTTFH